MIELSKDLALADEVLTEALAIVATRGAGKTYTSTLELIDGRGSMRASADLVEA